MECACARGHALIVFGFSRWLRLLFGREFNMQDLLLVWDAIFADGPPFLLVDYICIAMLATIRHLRKPDACVRTHSLTVLGSDYTGCLNYLMRYPPVTDIRDLLLLALHLRNPKVSGQPNSVPVSHITHCRQAFPAPSTVVTNYSNLTRTGRPHPNTNRDDMPTFSRRDSKKSNGETTSSPRQVANASAPTAEHHRNSMTSTLTRGGQAWQMQNKMLDSITTRLPDSIRDVALASGQDAIAVVDKTRRRVVEHAGQFAALSPKAAAEQQHLHDEVETLRRRCEYLTQVITDAADQLDRACDSRKYAHCHTRAFVQVRIRLARRTRPTRHI
jgi:hypothetical protein